VVFVAVGEGWFDRVVWCEEFRCRCDAALAEGVSAPHCLSDHEAAEEPEDGVLLDTFSQQRPFGGSGMIAGLAALARHQGEVWPEIRNAISTCEEPELLLLVVVFEQLALVGLASSGWSKLHEYPG
jgi:hypothetical protein